MPSCALFPLSSPGTAVPQLRHHLAAAALLACTSAAWAQSPQATLPEVQVTDAADSSTESQRQYTARELAIGKTAQTQRETPQSVSVVTRQQLDDRQITKVEDALKQVTGVSITRFDGAGNYNSFQARGFDIGAILLDGVAIPQGNYSTLDTAVYDRIEVLRGPAGLLQGTSEPGGAVNLVRKRARSTLGISAEAALGSWDLRRGVVDVTGGLNAAGTVRARVVAVAEDRNSHVDTLFNNKRMAYGTLEWDLAPGTTLSVGATQQRVKSVIDQGLPAYANGQLADVPVSSFAGLRTNRQDLETTDVFAELEHRLSGGGQLRLSVRDVDRNAFYASARANSALAANGSYRMESVDGLTRVTTRAYDLFASTPFSLGGRSHTLMAGVSRNEGKSYDNNFAYGSTPWTASLLQPDYNHPYPSLTLPGYSAITTRTEDALYGQAQLQLADPVKLLLGGRLSWADVTTRSTSTGAVTSASDPGRQFIPNAALLWDFHPQLTAYTSYAETFVVQRQLDARGQLLKPRTGEQVEVGVKGEFLAKRLQTHAALFRILDEGRAITDPSNLTASIAGGKVRAQGLELEASGQIAPGWDVLAGYAYTQTKYLQAAVTQQGQTFATHSPRHMLNLYTRYAFGGAVLQGLSVGAGASYRSAFYAQSGAVRLTSGNYSLFNADASYQINEALSLGLAVSNLFDKKYYEKVSSVGRQNFYGEPRRITVSLKARF